MVTNYKKYERGVVLMEKIYNDLKISRLFNGVEYENIKEHLLAENFLLRKYEKSTIVHLEGEVCNGISLIISGTILIQNLDANGNTLTIREFSRGDIIGENLLFSENNFFPMTISTKEATEIMEINRDLVLKLCQADEGFLKNLLYSISEKALILSKKINLIALKSVRELILNYIKHEYILQKSYTIMMKTTKKELAERLGIQRTSLSRELKKMKDEGLLTYDSKSITILNHDYIFNL